MMVAVLKSLKLLFLNLGFIEYNNSIFKTALQLMIQTDQYL